MKKEIEVPEDVDVTVKKESVRVESGDTSVEKGLSYPGVVIENKGDKIEVSTESKRKEDVSIVGTYTSAIKNMISGVKNPFVYELQSVYSHFPTNVKVQGNEVLIENFMGEKNPRKIEIFDNVNVEVDGEKIKVSGADKESVGQTAARIEEACHKGNRDPRKFQDGVYITKKGERNE